MQSLKHPLLLAVASVLAVPAMAQTPLNCDKSFGFRADVNAVAGNTLCAARADVFLDSAKDFKLSNSTYTPISAALVQGRFSDVNVVLSYSANSSTLNYNFVELNVKGSFNGGTRDISEDQFVEFVKKSDILGRLINYQAKNSPSSPIAGLGGAIPSAGAADFASGFENASKVSAGAQRVQAGGSVNNLIGVALGYSSFNVAGTSDKVSVTTLPLSYTIRNDIDPRRQLVFSMPLTKVSIGDADSYHGGLGVGYRVPLSDQWTLTPSGKLSLVASKDRATVSTVMSAALMSTYIVEAGNFDVAIGNMLGYYKTGRFSSGDYNFNPDVALTMTRNGLMLSQPMAAFGSNMALEYSIIDTRYVGNKPFVTDSQEFGVTLGTNKNASNARSFMRFGLSYVRAKASHGVAANFGYWF